MSKNGIAIKSIYFASVIGIGLVISGCVGKESCVPTNEDEQVICDRQEKFSVIGRHFKAIDDEIKSGDPDYDEVAESAKAIVTTGKDIPSWFPEGTGPETGFATDAKKEIWEQPEKFSSVHNDFITESERLVLSANLGEKSALEAQFNITGVTCSNCHKPFRVEQ